MFRAEPPAPVAAFGYEQSFVSAGEAFARKCIACFGALDRPLIGFSRVAQKIPCADVLAVTDPDVEIRADPGSRKDSFEFRYIGRGLNRLAHRQRANFGIFINQRIRLAQKIASVACVIFPSVFAVKNQADRCRLSSGLAFGDESNAAVQIFCGGICAHAAVDEADQVRQIMVAKEADY